ncbi:MAG: hypothetical protein GY856_00240 [bacterium]|nr:hypothetical protein [bacterium]
MNIGHQRLRFHRWTARPLVLSRRVPVLLLAAMLAAGSAAAREAAFESGFSNPGARSMGFGGAFVARADDATAAFANPAGLIQLLRPELSVEGRFWKYAEQLNVESSTDLKGLSFVSFAWPRKKWSVAAYGHQLMNLELSGDLQDIDSSDDWYSDFMITHAGVSAAYRVTETLSFGIGLSYFQGTFSSEYFPEYGTAASFAESSYLAEFRAADDDTWENGDWGTILGFLWNCSKQWNVGGSYRQGPRFDYPIAFPDVGALGLSFQSAGGGLTVGVEWDHVHYSTTMGVEGLEDENEFHVGAEYAFLKPTPIFAVRLGAWTGTDHRVHIVSDDPLHPANRRSPDDEIHLAVGFGVAFERFQVDFGVDLSDLIKTASVSMIWGF